MGLLSFFRSWGCLAVLAVELTDRAERMVARARVIMLLLALTLFTLILFKTVWEVSFYYV